MAAPSGASGAALRLRGGPVWILPAIRAVWPLWLRLLAASTVAWFALYVWVWPTPALATRAGPSPETRWFGAGRALGPYLQKLGPDGRRLYAIGQVLDLVFVGLYVTTLFAGIRRAVLACGPRRLRWLAVLPIATAALDVAEDASLIRASTGYPRALSMAQRIVGFLAPAKLILFLTSASAFAIVGAWAVWARKYGWDHQNAPRRRDKAGGWA